MKKALYLLSLACLLCTCYDGPVGPREEYLVSGHVYYPDSTPLPKCGITVIDYEDYSFFEYGKTVLENNFKTSTDRNGYFEVSIPNGGMKKISVTAARDVPCDTADSRFYHAGGIGVPYSGKHGFEGLKIYTQLKEVPQRYPYWVPSYPFIGDSVQIIARESIQKVEFLEESKTVLLSMEYQDGDTAVMFFIPETASLEKLYQFGIYTSTGSEIFAHVNLRKH